MKQWYIWVFMYLFRLVTAHKSECTINNGNSSIIYIPLKTQRNEAVKKKNNNCKENKKKKKKKKKTAAKKPKKEGKRVKEKANPSQ